MSEEEQFLRFDFMITLFVKKIPSDWQHSTSTVDRKSPGLIRMAALFGNL